MEAVIHTLTAITTVMVVAFGIATLFYIRKMSVTGAGGVENAIAYLRANLAKTTADPICPNEGDELTHEAVAQSSTALIHPFTKAIICTYD